MDKNTQKKETVTGRMSAMNGFSWRYGYDISIYKKKVLVQVNIRLIPHGGVTRVDLDRVKSKWEKEIEDTWSNKFLIRTSSGDTYPVIIDVSFKNTSVHHQVIVRPGGGRSEVINWNIMDSPLVASHEFGHMIGLYDEYKGGALDPENMVTDPTSIMTSYTKIGETYSRHYKQFLKWFEKKMNVRNCVLRKVNAGDGKIVRK